MKKLATAKIQGTFGIAGHVKIKSLSGEYEHLENLTLVTIRAPQNKSARTEKYYGEYEVESCKIRQTDALLKLRGIDCVEDAKKISGATIFVSRNMACPLNEGEFYVADLCTSVLVYKGTTIGNIVDVVNGGGGWLLEISEINTGRCFFIPFRAEFIENVDIKNRQVELMHHQVLE